MNKKIIKVKVKTNSKENKIEKKDEVYLVFVKSSPEKGKANKEILKLISKEFNSKARIISGKTSKEKLIELYQ